jgi:2-oxoglutarate ferredoxin oxidoreductase subunit gamma
MNRPSLEKFAPTVKAGGVVFVNASIIPIGSGRLDVDELRVPIIELAKALGNVKAANIIALAAFVARSRIVSFEALTEAVKQKFAEKAKLIPLNLKALDAGRQAAVGS